MGLRRTERRGGTFWPTVEQLEGRFAPAAVQGVEPAIIQSIEADRRTGVLLVAPPAQDTVITVAIRQQLAQLILPHGSVISGNGLKTAEGHTPVVDWTPT